MVDPPDHHANWQSNAEHQGDRQRQGTKETPLLKLGDATAIVRYLAAVWALLLIALMSVGTFSTARIGAMTWGQSHDIYSAAIAISEIQFGASGGLAFKEVEQAIADNVTSTKHSLDIMDDASRALAHDQKAISKGFQAAASLKPSQIKVPKTSAGYISDWAEDIGFADFHGLAFRLFGFNAYATHWLYIGLLFISAILFTTVFLSSSFAMASLLAGVTALFAETASASLFIEMLPTFAANRFVSTLAFLPLLHVVCALLRPRPLRPLETGLLVVQVFILAFIIAARSSAQWSVVAGLAVFLLVLLIRAWRSNPAATGKTGFKRRLERIRNVPQFHRLVAVAVLLLLVTTAFGAFRYTRINKVYFADDNMPNHMFWHSAFVGLSFHPDWLKVRPYGSGDSSDGTGFLLFEHAMRQEHRPHASPRGFYLVRTYEKFIRDQYFKFVRRHSRYTIQLFLYYKPALIYSLLLNSIGSINPDSFYFTLISLILSIFLFVPRRNGENIYEYLLAFSLIWLCSLLPAIWAYAGLHVIADQVWSTLFTMLALSSIVLRRSGVPSCQSVHSDGRSYPPLACNELGLSAPFMRS